MRDINNMNGKNECLGPKQVQFMHIVRRLPDIGRAIKELVVFGCELEPLDLLNALALFK